jgi:HSP20 family protein
MERAMTLMRLDNSREIDRAIAQAFGPRVTPAVPIEAFHRGDEYVVVLDVPGTDKKDIDVEVERDMVSIRVERRPAHGPDDQVLIDERPRGDFTRRLYLGDHLDSERLTADFTNGVLTLTIPVAESSKPRTIPVGSLADSTKADAAPTVPTNA